MRFAKLVGLGVIAALALCRATPLLADTDPSAADPARGAIHVYQQYLSSMRHAHCRFSPSCSQYAAEAIARYGIVEGSARAADRLMRCNTSSETRYPRDAAGLLVDPVEGGTGATAVHVPDWLLPVRDVMQPPIASGLSAERAARVQDAVTFAWTLQHRGDCERASAEFQRAGVLADTMSADSWAYACIGDCYFRSSEWVLADRAYLIAAMLSASPSVRAAVGLRAAASRFNAGAFVATARLLSDSALRVLQPAGFTSAAWNPVARDERPGPDVSRGQVDALAGLCGFAIGQWTPARALLLRAAGETEEPEHTSRLLLLAEFAARGQQLPHRSPGLAGAVSALLPGSGQAYSGHVKDGVRHLLFNAALLYSVVTLADHGDVPASVIVGGLELPFYVGNVLGAREAARGFNRDQRLRLLERALAASAR